MRTNLTINTDFAQTEVDQRLVNLTRFPTFFAEKRDFFLDGSAFFGFQSTAAAGNSLLPFFSRRIGLDAIVYTHNWLDDPLQNRIYTLDRRTASKFMYTYQFGR